MNSARSGVSNEPPARAARRFPWQVTKGFCRGLCFLCSSLLIALAVVPAGHGGPAQEFRSTGKSTFSNFEARSREADYWDQVHKRENEEKLTEKELQKQKRAESRNAVADLVQAGQALQSELIAAPAKSAPPPRPSIFEGKGEYLLLGSTFALLLALASFTLRRHKDEAEIQALHGGYLSDGTEVANFKMPDWFAPAPLPAPAAVAVAELGRLAAPVQAAPVKDPMQEFLEAAPAHLAAIRKVLQELARAGHADEWQKILAQLPRHVTALKEKANFWDARPAWQMSSALELLVQRIVAKPKDATPADCRKAAHPSVTVERGAGRVFERGGGSGGHRASNAAAVPCSIPHG